MLHNHPNQFRIQYRHLTLRCGDDLQRRQMIVRFPQLEQKLDLPDILPPKACAFTMVNRIVNTRFLYALLARGLGVVKAAG